MLNPYGPIITPAIIKPTIPGMLIFLSRMGDNKIMNKSNERINTGFCNGNSNSSKKCLKKSVIFTCPLFSQPQNYSFYSSYSSVGIRLSMFYHLYRHNYIT
jgi:hypothetical protein